MAMVPLIYLGRISTWGNNKVYQWASGEVMRLIRVTGTSPLLWAPYPIGFVRPTKASPAASLMRS